MHFFDLPFHGQYILNAVIDLAAFFCALAYYRLTNKAPEEGAIQVPRGGAIIFGDLIGKLDLLRVACAKCGRDGCYGLQRLIEKRGRDAKVIDWLDELTADCPKKTARNMNDPCGAKCPELAKVL
jgi:hypothetical protein